MVTPGWVGPAGRVHRALLFPVGPAAVAVGLALLGDQVLYQLLVNSMSLLLDCAMDCTDSMNLSMRSCSFLSDYLYG